MTLVGDSRIRLDEPTTGLDPRSRHTMWEIIRRLAARGVTIFLTRYRWAPRILRQQRRRCFTTLGLSFQQVTAKCVVQLRRGDRSLGAPSNKVANIGVRFEKSVAEERMSSMRMTPSS